MFIISIFFRHGYKSLHLCWKELPAGIDDAFVLIAVCSLILSLHGQRLQFLIFVMCSPSSGAKSWLYSMHAFIVTQLKQQWCTVIHIHVRSQSSFAM